MAAAEAAAEGASGNSALDALSAAAEDSSSAIKLELQMDTDAPERQINVKADTATDVDMQQGNSSSVHQQPGMRCPGPAPF